MLVLILGSGLRRNDGVPADGFRPTPGLRQGSKLSRGQALRRNDGGERAKHASPVRIMKRAGLESAPTTPSGGLRRNDE